MIEKHKPDEIEFSPTNFSKTLNMSDISSDHAINSPPLFPANNPHMITNESITLLDESNCENIIGTDQKQNKFRVQEGNLIIQSQVRDSNHFQKLFDELREPIPERCKTKENIFTFENSCSISIEPLFSNKTLLKPVFQAKSYEIQTESLQQISIGTQTQENNCEKILQKKNLEIEIQCKTIGNYKRENAKLQKDFKKVQAEFNRFKVDSEKNKSKILAESEKINENLTILNIQLCEEKMKNLNLNSLSKTQVQEIEKLKKEVFVKTQEIEENMRKKVNELLEKNKEILLENNEKKSELEKLISINKNLSELISQEKLNGNKLKNEIESKNKQIEILQSELQQFVSEITAKSFTDSNCQTESLNFISHAVSCQTAEIIKNILKNDNFTQSETYSQESSTQTEQKKSQKFSGELKSCFESMLSQRSQIKPISLNQSALVFF